MAQQLIVEGKDAIVLSNILMKRKLKPPLGYQDPIKFANEFVKQAEGVGKINTTIKIALENTALRNLGIILDANQVGALHRFRKTVESIEEIVGIKLATENNLTAEGLVWKISDSLKIGIWVMPNNQDSGYLEHFLLQLIDEDNSTYQFAQSKLVELMEQDFCEFTAIKKQKALLHTYLAWQKNPGLPMGTAVQANYLKANSPQAVAFEHWFQQVFELEN